MHNSSDDTYICSVLFNYYTMIKIQDMSFGYTSSRPIFSGFHLELGGGMVCGLLGKNGVGKSTLLHLAAGLLRPTAGSVTYRGTATFARHQAGELA